MKILVGFERSGIIRDAFASLGHLAWSCDIKPSRASNQYHILGDIYEALYAQKWDLIILHPMCTALTVAGNKTYAKGMKKHNKRLEAIQYTQKLWHDTISVCNKVCLENPVGVLATKTDLPKPQYIQPWMFGHKEQKKTALFLHGLPKLTETHNLYDEMMLLPKNQRERLHYLPPGPSRAEERSKTYQGLADAMAKQWA